jgi:opacity protein-like surface antigen
MMSTRTLLKFILLSCGVALISSPAIAGFYSYSTNWPNDAAAVDEKISTVDDAKPKKTTPTSAVCTSTGMDPNVEPRVSEKNRLYAKFGATFFSAEVRKMENISLSALSSAYLIENTIKDNYVSWEFGLGTKINALRWELEYMYDKNLSYNESPLFASMPESLTSTLESQGLWLNILWDVDKLKVPYFTPYLGVMGGVIWNKTRSTLTGGVGTGAAQNHSNYSIGWGLTAGARVAFWTRWFGYIGYKYLSQGSPRWKDSTGIMQLKGTYVINGFDVGVQYLLG